ncbi:MAG: hypothetical protein JWP87_5704 [Labilithrix sp.]|nr:hypothetical protein [Labilithrix sp.]
MKRRALRDRRSPRDGGLSWACTTLFRASTERYPAPSSQPSLAGTAGPPRRSAASLRPHAVLESGYPERLHPRSDSNRRTPIERRRSLPLDDGGREPTFGIAPKPPVGAVGFEPTFVRVGSIRVDGTRAHARSRTGSHRVRGGCSTIEKHGHERTRVYACGELERRGAASSEEFSPEWRSRWFRLYRVGESSSGRNRTSEMTG